MQYDHFGVAHCTSSELASLLYKNPALDISKFLVDDADEYNNSVESLFADMPRVAQYVLSTSETIEDFDAKNQSEWFIPESYRNFDIAKWVLDQCRGEAELQRAGEELLMFHDRNLFDLLKYLKYMVDTLREKKVLWGVGRGSSVASFVLYLIGVHRINSLYYSLPISEFLK